MLRFRAERDNQVSCRLSADKSFTCLSVTLLQLLCTAWRQSAPPAHLYRQPVCQSMPDGTVYLD